MKMAMTLCAAVLALSACNDSRQAAPQNAQAQPEVASQPETSAASVPPVPSPPSHNYAMEEDGEYGYQPAISEDEANNGVATKALELVRYRGNKDGTYMIDVPDESGAILRMECKEPCEYVKTRVIFDGQTIRAQTVPNAPRSLMHAVFEDAMNGQLKPYKKK